MPHSNFSSWISRFPITLAAASLLLSLLGVFFLYLAAAGNMYPWAYKQLINVCVFSLVALSISFIDPKVIMRNAYVIYASTLILLLIVEILGHKAMGAQRWINLGIFKLQPSELCKLSVTLALSRYFHDIASNNFKWNLKVLIQASVIIILPAIMVMKQPDLGTAIIIILVGGSLLFAAGLPIKFFLAVIVSIIGTAPFLWDHLHDYQKRRIMVFLNPDLDPMGAGYNIIQSKIAIGSGGLFGRGINQGTQSKLNFLPEHQTDFIFAGIAEEVGLVGSSAIIFLYLVILFAIYAVSYNSRTVFGKFLSIGVASMIFFHVFINIGMVIGMLPVVGVPLPLISYGGTMVASTIIAIGLVINIEVNR